MKKVYLVIALILLTVGCARIKPASKIEEVIETTIENHSNMELVIEHNGNTMAVPSNITATVSFEDEFVCRNSKDKLTVSPTTKTIVVNQDGRIETKWKKLK